MTKSIKPSAALQVLTRRWGTLGKWRRRLVFGVLAIAAISAGVAIYVKFTAWPPRLVLSVGGPIAPLAFSPDSTMLATSGREKVTLWDTRDGHLVKTISTPGVDVSEGLFTPDGRTLAVSGFHFKEREHKNRLDLIDVDSGRMRASVAAPDGGYGIDGVVLRDNGRVARMPARGTELRQVIDVDIVTGRVLDDRLLAYPVSKFRGAITADGRFAASAHDHLPADPSKTHTILIWDLDLDREVTHWGVSSRPKTMVALAFRPDGKTLAVAPFYGPVELWSITLNADHFQRGPQPRLLSAHKPNYFPTHIEFFSDGKRVVCDSRWMVQTSFSLESLDYLNTRRIWNRPFLPANELVILDPATGRRVGVLNHESRPVFSPDGRMVATNPVPPSSRGFFVFLRDLSGER